MRAPLEYRRLVALVLVVGASSCQRWSTEGTLRVKVEFEPDTRAECVAVTVRGGDGEEESSGPIERLADRTAPLVVAVYQGALGEHVQAQARGYLLGCKTELDPPEYSEVTGAGFRPFPPDEVVLWLSVHPAPDGGIDGGPTADGGNDGGPTDDGDAGPGDGGPADGGPTDEADAGPGDSGVEDAGLCGSEKCAPGDRCSAVSECVTPFPYTPSNFTEGDLDDLHSTVDVDITCSTTIDTGPDDGGLTVTPGCFSGTLPYKAIAQDGGTQAVLAQVRSLRVRSAGALTVVGVRPLIIAVRGDATIDGMVLTRAGADHGCTQPAFGSIDGDGDGLMMGGGGGGGFGLDGSAGAGNPFNSNRGVGQGASGNESLIPLKGGCTGGAGYPAGSADGGLGGGALQVSVVNELRINAVVAAPGRGGRGGRVGSGGGGGGSGGGLLFEGRRVVLGALGRLTANGGGGGEGSHSHDGVPGEDGRPDSDQNAEGGVGVSCGGNGGRGGSGAGGSDPGANAQGCAGNDPRGGGGGGGAVGRIRVNGFLKCERENGAIVSPDASVSGQDCSL